MKQASLLEDPAPAKGKRRGRSADSTQEKPEDLFARQCQTHMLPRFIRQHLFAKQALGRRWMFDFAFPDFMLAVEIEGVIPKQTWEAKLIGPGPMVVDGRVVNVQSVDRLFVVLGRHASITGMIEDMEKYNSAAMLGWTVIRFVQKQVKPRDALDMTQRVLAARGWRPAHAPAQ